MATNLELNQKKPNNVSKNKDVILETSKQTEQRKDSPGHESRITLNKSSPENESVTVTPLENEPRADVLLPNQPTPTEAERKFARSGDGQPHANPSTNGSTDIGLHSNQITQSEELPSSVKGKETSAGTKKAGTLSIQSKEEHQEVETSAISKNVHHRPNPSKNGPTEAGMPSHQPKGSKVTQNSAKVKDIPSRPNTSKNGPLETGLPSNQPKSSKVAPNSAKGKDIPSRPVLSKNGPTDAGLLSGQPKVSKAVSNSSQGKDVAPRPAMSKNELKSASLLNKQPTPTEVHLNSAKGNDVPPPPKLPNDPSINHSASSEMISNSTKEIDAPHGPNVSKNLPMESGLPPIQPTSSEVAPISVNGKHVSTSSNASKTGLKEGGGFFSNQPNEPPISSNSLNNKAMPPHQNPPTNGTEEGTGCIPTEQSKVYKETARSSKNTELRSAATKWKSKLSVHGTTDSGRRKSSGEVPLLLQERSDSTVVSIDGESPRNHVTLNVSGEDEAGDSPSRKLSLGDFVTQNVETTKGPEKWELLEGSPNGLAKSLPYIPVSLAYTCLLLNVVIPGSGTIIAGLSMLCCGEPRINAPDDIFSHFTTNIFVGVSQFFTVTFFLVGWIWSITWGIYLVLFAQANRIRKAEAKKLNRTAAIANTLWDR